MKRRQSALVIRKDQPELVSEQGNSQTPEKDASDKPAPSSSTKGLPEQLQKKLSMLYSKSIYMYISIGGLLNYSFNSNYIRFFLLQDLVEQPADSGKINK